MSQIQFYNGSPAPGMGVQTLTGNTGGAVGPDGANNINVIGDTGVVFAGNPGTNTITVSVEGSLVWNEVTATSANMQNNNGYITNNGALVTLTLPTTAVLGDIIRVAGRGLGGWLIAQNALQRIHADGADTTIGVGGSIASTVEHDCIELICIMDDTRWVMASVVGNLTII